MEAGPRIAILVARLSAGAAPCLAALPGQRGFAEEDLYLASGTGWSETLGRAWQSALDRGQLYSAFLWLDEDLVLDQGALDRLLADAAMVADPHEPLVMGGAVLDPSRERTLGGAFAQRDAARPLDLDLLRADRGPQMAASVSGEALLVTRPALDALGLPDPGLQGPRAAVDYGLRAYAAGVPVMLAGEPVGELSGRREAIDWARDDALAARHKTGLAARLRGALGL